MRHCEPTTGGEAISFYSEIATLEMTHKKSLLLNSKRLFKKSEKIISSRALHKTPYAYLLLLNLLRCRIKVRLLLHQYPMSQVLGYL